jgi:hypothetical protein
VASWDRRRPSSPPCMYRRDHRALGLPPLRSYSSQCCLTRANHRQHQEWSTHTTFTYGARISYPLCMHFCLMCMSWKNQLYIILCATAIVASLPTSRGWSSTSVTQEEHHLSTSHVCAYQKPVHAGVS